MDVVHPPGSMMLIDRGSRSDLIDLCCGYRRHAPMQVPPGNPHLETQAGQDGSQVRQTVAAEVFITRCFMNCKDPSTTDSRVCVVLLASENSIHKMHPGNYLRGLWMWPVYHCRNQAGRTTVPVVWHACVRYLYGLYDELARHLRTWTWDASRMRSMLQYSILRYTLHTSKCSVRY
jgi:hypothetical protein